MTGLMTLYLFSTLLHLGIAKDADTRNLTFVLSARGLPARDEASLVDPIARLYYNTNGSSTEPIKIGETENAIHSDNPSWAKVFWFDWQKGAGQTWKFKVRDQDAFGKDEPLGEADLDVDEYVEKEENVTILLSPQGTLTVERTTPIRFKLSAQDLPRKDCMPSILVAFMPDKTKSDPYVKCYFRKGIRGEDMQFTVTSTIDNVINAEWPEVIEFGNYQKGQSMYIRLRVKDADAVLGDDDIGEVLLEVDPFVEGRMSRTMKILRIRSKRATSAAITITPVE